ncbi:MAG: glycosyltransferase [Bacteroidota bacterium]
MHRNRPILLIATDWFVPGYKAGGPIRSCLNVAYLMRDDFAVYVLTSDRDFGSHTPYPALQTDQWTHFDEGIQVFYQSPQNSIDPLGKLTPDVVYLNSMFSPRYTLSFLWKKWRGKLSAKLVLAPRGMLHAGALQYKSLKKKLFLQLLQTAGIQKSVHFQATDEQEETDIRKHFGENVHISTIGNVPSQQQAAWFPRKKQAGSLRLIFVSRIGPKKNLDFLLNCLQNRKGHIQFDIIGPVEDADYWARCQRLIDGLPSNIEVTHLGALPHDKIIDALQQAHVFALSTHGENFGHAIFEAFQAGLPVLISDQTPWRNLQTHGIGWDISLHEQAKFEAALQEAIDMEEGTYLAISQAAWSFARTFVEESGWKEAYLQLFSVAENQTFSV